MRSNEVIRKIREGWGFRLPGERSLYWNPRGRVPRNHMELYLTWYLVRVSEDVLSEACRIREARQRALGDLRYERER